MVEISPLSVATRIHGKPNLAFDLHDMVRYEPRVTCLHRWKESTQWVSKWTSKLHRRRKVWTKCPNRTGVSDSFDLNQYLESRAQCWRNCSTCEKLWCCDRKYQGVVRCLVDFEREERFHHKTSHMLGTHSESKLFRRRGEWLTSVLSKVTLH